MITFKELVKLIPNSRFNSVDFKNDLSNVLSLDYIGGLIATLIFPFLLLPFVGLFYSSVIFGMVNLILGIVLNLVYFKKEIKSLILGGVSLISLLCLVIYGGTLLHIWDQKIYKQPIVEMV